MSAQNRIGQVILRPEGLAEIRLQMPGRVNRIDAAFPGELAELVEAALVAPEAKGVLLTSGHRDFCVGADLDFVLAERDPAAVLGASLALHRVLRRLETGGKPVAAVLAGSALGGGYELALAAHHRVAVGDGRVQIGLPEVSLGVIPGAGGTQRLPRLIGLQGALEVIGQGQVLRAAKALSAGLVDALADSPEAAEEAARAWLLAHPTARQPWDDKGFRWKGPRPGSPEAAQLFTAAAAMLTKRTAGSWPAGERALTVVQDGTRLGFDRACELEARHFAAIVVSDAAKDTLATVWVARQAAERQVGLEPAKEHGFRKVAVLGAGMMGAGLAWLCSRAGLEVVLKDVSEEAVARGLAAVAELIEKRGRHLGEAERSAWRERVRGSTALEAVRGADLVIEAVFEDLDLKRRVIAETLPLLSANAVFASNTSALPIAALGQGIPDPSRFIGLHFFSPVDQMQLVEVVVGPATSAETLGRCLAFARETGRLPIVVNDGYGFYTTRVFTAYILEGARMVAEGYPAAAVEWAARAAGMAVPPLQVFDEVSLELGRKAITQRERFTGVAVADPGAALALRMVQEAGRPGRAGGAGFYDYAGGKRQGIWPGLASFAGLEPRTDDVAVLSRRLLLAQVAEALRCLDEGVLRRPVDADVGAVFGLGFAPGTGGPFRLADRIGLRALIEELDLLAAAHGPRFAVPAGLRVKAERGESLYPVASAR